MGSDKGISLAGDLVEDTQLQDLKLQEEDAGLGNRQETELTVAQGLKYYRKAVLWSVVMSLATISESYDLVLVPSFYAYPQFQQKYGVQLPDGSYSIPAQWQVALTLSTVVTMIPGIFAAGWLVDRYGYRRVFFVAHLALIACIFITFFAPTVEVLLVGCLLMTIPCGIFSSGLPAYAAEICPLVLRGYLTTYVNLCWVMGHIIGAGVLNAMLKRPPSQWSYRIPFAVQWIGPAFLWLVCLLAPDSPWWHVRKGRHDEALKTLGRLISAPEETVSKQNLLAMMVHTTETERSMNISGAYSDCFRGTNRRRTEIAMMTWGCQILPGFCIQSYTTYFFTLAGLSTSDSFKLALGMYSIAFVGTVGSWFVQTRFGRRPIYLTGLVCMLPLMFVVGFLDLAHASSGVRWAQASIMLVWYLGYGLTIGPIPYAIAAEVGASQLRAKTVAIGRNTFYFLSIINTVVSPYMLNPTEGNLKGKAAFPAGVFTAMLLVWGYFRLPETKGMTPETLDHLFFNRVPARQFKKEADALQGR